MTHANRPPMVKRQCPAVVTLPQTDVEHFNNLPQAAFMMEQHLRCELVAGHESTHSALVQGVGNDLHWASWPVYTVELAPRCPAEAGLKGPEHIREPDICLLREGHPGDHYGESWF